LGIGVYRVDDPDAIRDALMRADHDRLRELDPPREERVAVWQTGLEGLDWLRTRIRMSVRAS
jgi:hypothetical protein